MKSKIDKKKDREESIALTMKMSLETQERNMIDSTYELLTTPGFLEQAGAG